MLIVAGLLAGIHEAQAGIAFRAASSAGARQAAISYRNSGTAISAASGNVTPTLSSVELNAFLVCLVEQHDNVAISFPTGWTQLYSISTTSTHRASAFYKLAAASETNPLITHPGGNSITARCSTFRGVDAANPLDVAYATQYAASSTSVASGSVTTLTANDMMLFAPHIANNPTIAAPTGTGGVAWTQRFYSSTTLGLRSAVGLYSGTKTAAGAVGPITSTVSAASENNGVLMALHDSSRLSIAVPTGTVAGDVMIAAIATTPSSVAITAPSGWTPSQAVTQATATSNRVATYYRVATASEPASYTWTLTTAHTGSAGGIVSYSGVDNTTPIDVSGSAATASALTHAAPGITTTAANDMLVTVHEYASSSSWTPPTGMTERVDIASRSANAAGITLEMNELQLAATGATGAKTATAASGADTGATVSIALRPAPINPHHIEIDHPGTGCAGSANSVTVKACGDAACSLGSLITSGVNVTLSPGGNVVAIGSSGSGVGTVTGTAGATTLGASASPAALNAATCVNTVAGGTSCSYTLQSSGFTISVPNGVAASNVTGTISSCAVPYTGAKSINFYTGYSNPSSGTRQATVNGTTIAASSPGTAVSLTFNASSQATFTLAYPDVGLVSLNAAAGTLNGSASFIMKPAGFVLSNIKRTSDNFANPAATTASGTAFVKAGEPFSITVTAVNSAGAATPNFGQANPPDAVQLTPSLVGGLGLSNNPSVNKQTTGAIVSGSNVLAVGSSAGYFVGDRIRVVGAGTSGADLITSVTAIPSGTSLTLAANAGTTVSGATVHYLLNAFSGGVATGTHFMWDEVGIITIMPSIADGSYMTAGNVIGDTSGNPSGNVGRFYLGKMAVQNASFDNRADLCQSGVLVADGATPCSPAFTYMGEEIDANFTLVPMSLNNIPLNNYTGQNGTSDFARMDPTVFADLHLAAVDRATAGQPYYLTSRIGNAGLPSVACDTNPCFTDTGAHAQANVTLAFMLTRNASPDGTYTAVDLGIAPLDGDDSPADATDLGNGSCNNPTVAACYDLDTDSTLGNDHVKLGTTEFRYGRFKIANANGSELLAMPIAVTAQYWNQAANSYLASADDNLTILNTTASPSSVVFSNWQKNLTSGSTGIIAPAGTASLVNGIVSLTLGAPGAGKNGSVDINITSPGYLPSNTARATFGVYKSNKNFIYQRESY